MVPAPPALAAEEHQALLDSLDLQLKQKPFRNPNWKPSQRRNKNIKQIIGEAARREASQIVTQNNSGVTTPAPQSTGALTPNAPNGSAPNANIAQAAQNLSTLVLERNLQASIAANGQSGGLSTGPLVTYTNVESAPSLNPARSRPYCDITGLPAPYTDPKTRLRYHNREIYGVIRTLQQGAPEQYLAARGAHVILK
ncbi:MAG: hypothetical protein MMC23_001940 [Stictis urceolatum]|nr:hypothetical protein [Stictis urceolata]